MARSPIFDGVDPALLALIQQVGGNYGPYKTNITSGYREGDPRFHGRGRALDVQLSDPKTGAALANYQDPTTAAAYQQFANAVYAAADPAMQQKLRWGGYFSGGKGKYGALDLMHFDTGGDTTPMAGGSWAGGFNDEQAKLWNMSAGGGVGGAQEGPAMPKTLYNYTPEQRRAAIASIESAGSGDYGALGPWTGDPKDGRDRAYGRYQVMGANIPVWSKEVLGRSITPEEFMADPKLQDAIFDKKFGDYVAKHGEKGAASMWFTGRPDAPDAKDVLGTTGSSYTDKYLKALGAPGSTTDNPAYKPPVAASDPLVAEKDKDKDAIGDWISSVADNTGATFGSGSGMSKPSTPAMAKPMTTVVQGTPNAIINPDAAAASRQQLAMAMARLNSGKLWG